MGLPAGFGFCFKTTTISGDSSHRGLAIAQKKPELVILAGPSHSPPNVWGGDHCDPAAVQTRSGRAANSNLTIKYPTRLARKHGIALLAPANNFYRDSTIPTRPARAKVSRPKPTHTCMLVLIHVNKKTTTIYRHAACCNCRKEPFRYCKKTAEGNSQAIPPNQQPK